MGRTRTTARTGHARRPRSRSRSPARSPTRSSVRPSRASVVRPSVRPSVARGGKPNRRPFVGSKSASSVFRLPSSLPSSVVPGMRRMPNRESGLSNPPRASLPSSVVVVRRPSSRRRRRRRRRQNTHRVVLNPLKRPCARECGRRRPARGGRIDEFPRSPQRVAWSTASERVVATFWSVCNGSSVVSFRGSRLVDRDVTRSPQRVRARSSATAVGGVVGFFFAIRDSWFVVREMRHAKYTGGSVS